MSYSMAHVCEIILKSGMPHIEWSAKWRIDTDHYEIVGTVGGYSGRYAISGVDLVRAADRNQITELVSEAAKQIERYLKDEMGEDYRPTGNQGQAPPGSSPQGVHPGENGGIRETGRTLMELIESE